MLLQILNQILFVVLAFLFGLFAYRSMLKFHRYLFLQLTSYVIIYILSYCVTLYQYYSAKEENNHWVFNLNILLETSLLSIGAFSYFKDLRKKNLIRILYCLFLAMFTVLIVIQGFSKFNVYAHVFSSLIIVIFYSIILYESFYKKQGRADLLISSGILVYFACNLPYFSMFNFLNLYHPELSAKLYHFITETLANLRYLLLAIGFWIIKKDYTSRNIATE